jgi:hypothetical protein
MKVPFNHFRPHKLTVCELIDDPAIGKPDRALGTCSQVIVVGDHEDRFSGLCQALEEMEDHFSGLRIQIACWLIRSKKDWIIRESTGNRYTLLLSARQRIRKTVGLF